MALLADSFAMPGVATSDTIGQPDPPTWIYRLWSPHGVLLYVGITTNVQTRLSQHARDQPWWPQVAMVTSEVCGTRFDALQQEAAVIQSEHPLWNVAHVVDPASPPVILPEPVLIWRCSVCQRNTGPASIRPGVLRRSANEHWSCRCDADTFVPDSPSHVVRLVEVSTLRLLHQRTLELIDSGVDMRGWSALRCQFD